MANNRKPQFLKDIFSLQSNGAGAETLDAAVRQDKDRFSSDRIASAQPASVNKGVRSHPTNPKSTRSKNSPIHNTRAVHLNLWIDPIVKGELQRIAKAEDLTLSKTGSALLTQALQHNVDMQYSALLQPVIESVIRKEMQGISSRLAWLLVRVAFDTGQTRSLVTNILGRQQGMTEETLKTILAMSQRTAKGNITRRSPEMTELMAALEKWLNGNRESNLYEKQ
jgi:hypothetical protein